MSAQQHSKTGTSSEMAISVRSVVVLGRQQWPQLRPHIQSVIEAINAAESGSSVEVHVPFAE